MKMKLSKYLEDIPQEKLVHKNNILGSRSRQTGVCGLISEKEEGFTFDSYILRIKINESKIDPTHLSI